MRHALRKFPARRSSSHLAAQLVASLLAFSPAAYAQSHGQVPRREFARGEMTLQADQQKQVGKIFYADGHVDIVYRDIRLRADHVEYDGQTKQAIAHGHVRFDYQTQHFEADEARYNFATERGSFRNVRGEITAQRRPNPSLLVSPNPLSFAAAEVQRTGRNTYVIRRAWVTVCRSDHAIWKFHARQAVIHIEKSVKLENATFRVFSVPLVYLPYASAPAGQKLRQSGFLVPDVGQTTSKGFIFGDSFYWAPTDWMDVTLGAQYLSRRGWGQNVQFRMRPWPNARFDANYTGIIDRGIKTPGGTLMKQGGHEYHVFFDALLPHGWRAVADLDQLSSLTYRLAFSETFRQAVNSEVNNAAFLTKNTDGFSLNFATLSYKNFLSTSPETSIVLRTAPEFRASSVDRAPWKGWPIYWGFSFFTDAVHRETNVPPQFSTPSFVSRTEFAPRVTIPLHWGPYLGVTPSFTLRTTRYGGQLRNGAFLGKPFVRTTEEFTLDLRPPTFDRVWKEGTTKWMHAIEPHVAYRYVNGVNDFGRFLLFDGDETLTDTNEVEYGVTQRLFRKQGSGGSEELASWDLSQKYYFDPTFGGAFLPGQRNVFQALDSLTPFAFADRLHRFSPVISDLRIDPGRRYDAQFRVDFDPVLGQMTAIGTLLKIRPYRDSFISLAHFSAINIPPTSATVPPVFRPWSNQVRALVGYGSLNRPGWNTTLGFSYDISQQFFQNEVYQVSYNGSCCGIGFEFRRLALGAVRSENQYRIVFLIANIGSLGNLHRREKIF